MAKVTVKMNLKKLKGLTAKEIASSSFQKKLGVTVVGMIKDLVEVGLSPVKGQGRFEGYKADRALDRKNKKYYPNSVKKDFPAKQRRPVNLTLSGKMLKAFTFKGITGGVRIGLVGMFNKKLKTIFEAHNATVAPKRLFPRRAVIPDAEGEQFVPKIMRKIKEMYAERIKEMLSKK